MKKIITIFSIVALTLIGGSSFIKKTSTGVAGHTGSPGEPTCSNCHGGGSSSTKGVTISAVPAFTANQYYADSIYKINVQVGAVGFSRYGFDCEILDSVDQNAGVMQNQGPGVTFVNTSSGRLNAIHTAKKVGTNGVTFNFEWVAPSSGKAIFYVCGNAVNNNGQTSGDIPLPATLELYPAALPVDSNLITGIKKSTEKNLAVTVSPNPISDMSTVSFWIKESKNVTINLLSIEGKTLMTLHQFRSAPGYNSNIINFDGVPSGIYFLRTEIEGLKSSQKLITVQ